MGETVFVEISLIIILCAVLSWLTLVLRQPLIIAYLAGGFLMGLPGLGLIKDTGFLDGVAGLGITLLLFLAEHRAGILDSDGIQLVQLVTLFSLILFSYFVIACFPSPLATNPKLKQD